MWRRLRELRKWDLTPIGAVLVVALLAVLGFVFLETSGKSREERIRDYFGSERGGGAPLDQARLIHLRGCSRARDTAEYGRVLKCRLEYHRRIYSACFAFGNDPVVLVTESDVASLPNCRSLTWDPATRSLVAA